MTYGGTIRTVSATDRRQAKVGERVNRANERMSRVVASDAAGTASRRCVVASSRRPTAPRESLRSACEGIR